MSNTNNPPIIPALTPFLSGVPSRRHHVVLRRAMAQHQELINFLLDLAATATEARDPTITACHHEFVVNVISRVSAAIHELENCTGAAAKAEIATGLQLLKARFQVVRNELRM
jgi:hypothetical protein